MLPCASGDWTSSDCRYNDMMSAAQYLESAPQKKVLMEGRSEEMKMKSLVAEASRRRCTCWARREVVVTSCHVTSKSWFLSNFAAEPSYRLFNIFSLPLTSSLRPCLKTHKCPLFSRHMIQRQSWSPLSCGLVLNTEVVNIDELHFHQQVHRWTDQKNFFREIWSVANSKEGLWEDRGTMEIW